MRVIRKMSKFGASATRGGKKAGGGHKVAGARETLCAVPADVWNKPRPHVLLVELRVPVSFLSHESVRLPSQGPADVHASAGPPFSNSRVYAERGRGNAAGSLLGHINETDGTGVWGGAGPSSTAAAMPAAPAPGLAAAWRWSLDTGVHGLPFSPEWCVAVMRLATDPSNPHLAFSAEAEVAHPAASPSAVAGERVPELLALRIGLWATAWGSLARTPALKLEAGPPPLTLVAPAARRALLAVRAGLMLPSPSPKARCVRSWPPCCAR